VLFNTLDYARFFAVVFAVSWLLVRAKKVRLCFLLAASYFFYARWDYRFLPLIWGSSTADFLLARAMAKSPSERSRKVWLAFTVVMNLGVLGFFKYWNFGIESVSAALGLDPSNVTLRVALPVGISFFTFESMSYVIDVYRRELEPTDSYLEYLTFVAFFPHLVAGPIVRPRDLLPQLHSPSVFSSVVASEGLFLVAVGLFKKIVIGDYLALNLVDRVFDAPVMYSAVEVYAAVLGYALQIYCDFSGYTDIAIGSALLLGVRFPKNFDSPYKARDIADFWRRWHISLSSWLRDYLYIPLGGNRKGRARTYVNLFLTMVLGGLWHGAAWTFVVWGTLHGVALAVHRFYDEWRRRRGAARSDGLIPRALGTFVTFHFVCAAWVFFRASSFENADLVFARLGSLTFHHQNLPPSLLLVLALGFLTHYWPKSWFDTVRQRFVVAPGLVQGLALFAVAVVLRHMATSDAVPFVYFQF
jgi:D-alanyl-lipoteichoic acid acyltransferase DltB (MBOAT superfamily)